MCKLHNDKPRGMFNMKPCIPQTIKNTSLQNINLIIKEKQDFTFYMYDDFTAVIVKLTSSS